jgi:thiol:disulfide interchange protein DsbD
MTGPVVRLLAAICVLLLAPPYAGAVPVQAPHVEVELVADVDAVRAGEPFDAGLRFALEKDWHVYWSNPGDSGLAPRVRWTLPPGTEVGELTWPHPHRIAIGPLVNFGYEGEILLPVRVTPPATLAPGETFALAARADWLVCKEDCIPGEADLALALPVASTPPGRSRWAPLFDAMRALVPRERPEIVVEAVRHEGRVELRLTARDGGPVLAGAPPASLTFFPADAGLIENAAEQPQSIARDLVTVSLERAHQRREPVERLRGALVALPGFAPDAAPAIAVDVAVRDALPPAAAKDAAPTSAPVVEGDARTVANAAGGAPLGLGLALLLAALGGLLLNVMPCVFPVLSIKILDFVRQAGGRPGMLRRHGYVYAAGVLVSFWVLAGLLLALRAGGEGLGWGFQLQSPAFVVLMIFLMFALSLSLLGLYDVGVGMTAIAGRVPQGDGLAGSFATGVLATVVATPCTAPFMGPALGAALALPPASALLIFTALGAGMALPYVVLCLVPGWVRRLPRPGPWLETFKQLMAFPLLATVVWLVWVLGHQAGVDAILGTLAGLLLLALGLWLRARFGAYGQPLRLRRLAHGAALLLAVAGVGLGLVVRGTPAGAGAGGAASGSHDAYGIAWRDYSAATLAELRAAGTPVFVDFTAAWCLTCKVNEHVVFSSAEVRDAFAARDVAMLRADWTSRDDEITRALAAFGRSGVPLYVLYGGAEDDPQVLPSVLTRGIVLEALEKLG